MLYSIEVIFDHDGSCQSTLVLSAHSMLCPRGYLRIPWSIFNPPHCFELSCCTYAMLSHFSHVRLCVTPQTAAHQAPPSLRFSRQEYWSGVPLPSLSCCTWTYIKGGWRRCWENDASSAPADSPCEVKRVTLAFVLL